MSATGAMTIAAATAILRDPKLISTAFEQVLKYLSEKNPNLAAARAQVGELQTAMYSLQMENIGLQGQVGKLEVEIQKAELRLADDQAWKDKTAGIELFTTPGGADVYARHGNPPYFCPVCFDKKSLIPIQIPQRHYVGECPSCKAHYDVKQPKSGPIQTLGRRIPPNQGLGFGGY